MKNAPWALASGEKTDFPAGTLHSAFSRRFIFRGSALRCSVEPQLKRPKRWLKRLTPTLAFDPAPHRKDSELRPERRLRRNMFSKPPIVRVNGANVWGQWSPLCGKDPGSGTLHRRDGARTFSRFLRHTSSHQRPPTPVGRQWSPSD